MLHETRIHFQHRIVKTQFSFCREAAQFNKLAPPNPAIASQFQSGHHWRGIGEPDRWTEYTPDDKIQKIAEAFALDACDFLRDHFRITLDWSDASVQHIESVMDRFHREAAKARPTPEQGIMEQLGDWSSWTDRSSPVSRLRRQTLPFGRGDVHGIASLMARRTTCGIITMS